MVHTDTDSRVIGLADIQKRDEPVAYLPEFLCIFFIGILQMLESTCGVYVVARVDTDYFRLLRCHICYFRVEMNIGHQWGHVAVLT